MKSKNVLKNIRKTKDLIRTGFNNSLKCSHGQSESPQHRLFKYYICRYCWENGLSFATEVVFMGGGRADVVIFDYGLAVEICHTESIKKVYDKKYPIPILAFHTKYDHIEIDLLLDEIGNFEGNLEIINLIKNKHLNNVTNINNLDNKKIPERKNGKNKLRDTR